MMKQMRENTKVIIWFVVVAFIVTIFAVWGLDLQTSGITGQGQGQGLVGKVNGVPVTPQAYQAAYTQLSQQYRAVSPTGQLSAAQQELLRDQAWTNIVNNILTEQEIKKLRDGIRASDDLKIGARFFRLRQALARANKATRNAVYARFARAHPESYYGRLAKEAIEQ